MTRATLYGSICLTVEVERKQQYNCPVGIEFQPHGSSGFPTRDFTLFKIRLTSLRKILNLLPSRRVLIPISECYCRIFDAWFTCRLSFTTIDTRISTSRFEGCYLSSTDNIQLRWLWTFRLWWWWYVTTITASDDCDFTEPPCQSSSALKQHVHINKMISQIFILANILN